MNSINKKNKNCITNLNKKWKTTIKKWKNGNISMVSLTRIWKDHPVKRNDQILKKSKIAEWSKEQESLVQKWTERKCNMLEKQKRRNIMTKAGEKKEAKAKKLTGVKVQGKTIILALEDKPKRLKLRNRKKRFVERAEEAVAKAERKVAVESKRVKEEEAKANNDLMTLWMFIWIKNSYTNKNKVIITIKSHLNLPPLSFDFFPKPTYLNGTKGGIISMASHDHISLSWKIPTPSLSSICRHFGSSELTWCPVSSHLCPRFEQNSIIEILKK